MRAFIAIELPQDIKEHLGRIQTKLKTAQADVKWTSPSNIHLTLKFLGEIDERQKDAALRAMRTIAALNKPFTIALGLAGGFPGINSPRVIWIGLELGDQRVKALADGLEKELTASGFPPETRKFSPHITLGRTRSGKNRRQLSEVLEALNSKPAKNAIAVGVKEIALFKSTLTPRGSIYEKLETAALI
jgi:2'-5' RNA ligase